MANPLFLRALGYRRAAEFSIDDPGKVAHLVSFLENRKVRQWPIEARGVLSTPGDAWLAGFNKYLADAECPIVAAGPITADQVPLCVSWLLKHAIAVEYEDQAVSFNERSATLLEEKEKPAAAAAAAGGAGSDAMSTSPPETPVVTGAGAAAGAGAGAGAAAASSGGGGGAGAGAGASGEQGGGPTKVARKGPRGAAGAARPTPRAARPSDIDDFVLGFDTGDATVNKAAKVLRMLYVRHLRSVQDRMNAIIIAAQEGVRAAARTTV